MKKQFLLMGLLGLATPLITKADVPTLSIVDMATHAVDGSIFSPASLGVIGILGVVIIVLGTILVIKMPKKKNDLAINN